MSEIIILVALALVIIAAAVLYVVYIKKTIDVAAQKVAEKQMIALEKRQAELSSSNRDMMNDLMRSIRDSIENSSREQSMNTTRIETQMKAMAEGTERVTEQANNLTKALKGDSKQQGDWGESHCEQILMDSGLENERHYHKQVVVKDKQNSIYRLDFVLHCPGKGDIIIDSKVTLTSLLTYKDAENDKDRKQAMKEIYDSVRKHVEELARKQYGKTDKRFYENVIMYVPIREALYLATLHNPQLLNDAYKKGVWVVDSSSIMAIIAMVKTMWVYEEKDKNMEKILVAAGKLYDKFSVFSDNYVKLGSALNTVNNLFHDTQRELSDGNANIVKQVKELKDLGAITNKTINERL